MSTDLFLLVYRLCQFPWEKGRDAEQWWQHKQHIPAELPWISAQADIYLTHIDSMYCLGFLHKETYFINGTRSQYCQGALQPCTSKGNTCHEKYLTSVNWSAYIWLKWMSALDYYYKNCTVIFAQLIVWKTKSTPPWNWQLNYYWNTNWNVILDLDVILRLHMPIH